MAGTPLYMSPEQLDPDLKPKEPADVWALGCIMIEMLTGQPYSSLQSKFVKLNQLYYFKKILLQIPKSSTKHSILVNSYTNAL